jgi:mannosyltransferase
VTIHTDRLKQGIPITLILFLALGLYAYQLGTESLWFDESFSLDSARNPLNLNRPLYFLLLRAWMTWGRSEVWLRTLSVLWGLGSVLTIYSLGRCLFSHSVGLIASILLTLSPLAISQAQEVRFYTMSTFLGLSGNLFLSSALKQWTIAALGGWAVLRFLAILTTPLNVLLLLPDSGLIGFKLHRYIRPVRFFRQGGWVLLLAIIPAVWVLFDVVPPLLALMSEMATLNGVVKAAPKFINFVGGLATFTAWPLKTPQPEWNWVYQPFFNLYAVLVVGLLAFVLVYNRRSAPTYWCAAWGLVPLTAMFGVAQFSTVLWRDQYLSLVAPYILMLLALGFTKIWRSRKVMAMGILVLYAIAVGSSLARYYTMSYRHDWRNLAQVIQTDQQPGDRILLYPEFFLSPFQYYHPDLTTVETIDRDAEVSMTEQALSRVSRHQRIWLIFPKFKDWDADSEKMLTVIQKKGFTIQGKEVFRSQWGEDIQLSLATPNLTSR